MNMQNITPLVWVLTIYTCINSVSFTGTPHTGNSMNRYTLSPSTSSSGSLPFRFLTHVQWNLSERALWKTSSQSVNSACFDQVEILVSFPPVGCIDFLAILSSSVSHKTPEGKCCSSLCYCLFLAPQWNLPRVKEMLPGVTTRIGCRKDTIYSFNDWHWYNCHCAHITFQQLMRDLAYLCPFSCRRKLWK